MFPLGRRLRKALTLVALIVVTVIAWETVENLQIGPPFWGAMPAPKTAARGPGYTLITAGAAVVGEEAAHVTLRAWSPTPRVVVTPRAGATVRVTLTNVPLRARLSAPTGVVEHVNGRERTLTGPGDRRWEFQYVQAERRVSFAVLGDVGASPTFAAALTRAAEAGADFFVVVGDLLYRDEDVAPSRALLEPAPLPVYVIRGNHDYATRRRRDLIGMLGPPFYAFEYGGAAFVMLDNGAELLPGVGVWSDQHEWLTHTLTEPHGAPLFVFMHKSPLRAPDERWWHSMWDRAYARRLARDFERAGVRMVFAGHRHDHSLKDRRGVTYVTTGEGKRGPGKQPVMALVTLDRDDADVRFVPVWPEETAAR